MVDSNVSMAQPNARWISTSSVENEKISRKSSVEKKVSFERSVSEVDELKAVGENDSNVPR